MRIGIDIGGTFTDIVGLNPRTGRLKVLKRSTTSHRPTTAVTEGMRTLLEEDDTSPQGIELLVHGTTVATNAILEGQWAPTALVTTQGFRDTLEIGRQSRPDLYDFFTERPEPLVPRYLRYEVSERIDDRGEVVRPLDEGATREIANRIAQQNVESVAVTLLFSFLNPQHELRIKEILSERLEIPIVLSSETLPLFREYERMSTTVMNAALVPVLHRYLGVLEEESDRMGVSQGWRVMQSNAGVVSSRFARKNPVSLLLSGPAAGIEGARFIGELTGFRNLITLDMGGTSCDVSLITNGRPWLTDEGKIAGRPVRTPMVDIRTIGAGGGSIAWLDRGGALRVGPRSAGADPGPVCYGRAGEEPTVTDAQLVLGRFDPENPLGDIPRLDLEGAREAISERIARRLGTTVEEAATGIITVAEANMERAIRVISVERGHDPREFALLAFGGAGPLHASALARRLGIPTVIIPRWAGVLSAIGLLTADLTHHFAQTLLRSLATLHPDRVNGAYRAFIAEGRRRLAEDGLTEDQMDFVPSMDLRYQGQSYELNLSVPDRQLTSDDLGALARLFHQEHEKRYGHAAPREPIEAVNLRLMAIGKGGKPTFPRQGAPGAEKPVGRRPVHIAPQGWTECPCSDRQGLSPGAPLEGPAIIEGEESTTFIEPGQKLHVDEHGHLIVEVHSGSQR